MTLKIDTYYGEGADLRRAADHEAYFKDQLRLRARVVFKIQHDLVNFAIGQGFTQNQIRSAINALFNLFAAEWAVYHLAGSTALSEAIAADATLTWLDLDAGGITIRQRLINRLT